MERDLFDRKLQQKFRDHRIEPPTGMWDSIRDTLSETGLAAPQEYRRPMAIRMPRRMRIGVSIAAALLLCMVTIGIRMMLDTAELTPAPQLLGDQVGLPDPLSPETVPAIADDQPQRSVFEAVAGTVRGRLSVPVIGHVGPTAAADAFRWDDIDTMSGYDTYVFRLKTSPVKEEWAGRGDRLSYSVRHDYPGFATAAARTSAATTISLFSGSLSGGRNTSEVTSGILTPRTLSLMENFDGPTLSSVNPQRNIQSIRHKMPVSVGASASFGLTRRISLETGLVYTYLHSEGQATTADWNYDFEQKLHYLGIPLYIRFDFLQTRWFDMYASAGGMVEKCVSAKHIMTVNTSTHSGIPSSERLDVKGVQSSVGLRLGGQFNVNSLVGIYVEPSLGYYFDNDKNPQPENYRTKTVFDFSFRAGVRFSFGK